MNDMKGIIKAMKKISVFVMVMVFSLTIGMQKVDAADISVYGVACVCGGSSNIIKTVYGSWKNEERRLCDAGYDLVQSRTKTITYKCNRCGYESVTNTIEHRVICSNE